jgi:hypothetical protein
MDKSIFGKLILGLITMLIPTAINAQLFEENELFPNTTTIKGKYYNGSGGRGYWSKDYVDSFGRVIRKESYRKKQLMSRHEIEYDNPNNKTLDIQTFDYNNPDRVDTLRFEYKYSGNRIIQQIQKRSTNDSTVIDLIENLGDSVLMYQEKAFHYRPKTGKTDIYETIYTLRYRNRLLMSNEVHDKSDNSKKIQTYEYYDNGRLKRRTIERIPKPVENLLYVGGPGSDDERYKYTFDSKGRVKKFYRIIEGKKFKIAVYKYD